MSTRSVIARKTSAGFSGNYHHWDGYPSGVGATLYDLYHGHFKKDIKTMLHFLIEEHPAGWSNINGADFTMEPGFVDYKRVEDAPENSRPQCYCHGDRHEKANGQITMQGDTGGAEYAYAIDEATCQMTIYAYHYPSHDWKECIGIDLNAPAPDWEKLD